MSKRIVVIGGGISGLAACIRLLDLKKETKAPVEVVLLESSPKLGGVISSFKWQNCLLEAGPDAIFTEKPWGLEFLKQLGLEADIIETNPHHRRSFIALKNELHPVPEGFYLVAPSKLWPLLTTRIFSLRAKLRMALEPLIPRRRTPAPNGHIPDESLDSFVRRRLGAEALERMAQPMVAGIYSADPKELSLAATFPKFLEWERKHGSVVLGLWNRRSEMRFSHARGPRYSLFVSLKEGMQSLVQAAAKKIPAEALRLGAGVKSIHYDAGSGKYHILGSDFELDADGLCLALPAHRSAELIKSVRPELAAELAKIKYLSGMSVNLVFNKADAGAQAGDKIDGFGFVVPAAERKIMSGCTFASAKFLGRAPQDRLILRAYIGGATAEQWIGKSDVQIVEAVKRELKELLGIHAEPLAYFVHRYHQAMPQYKVGHLDLLKTIERELGAVPGLALAGNGYRGPGIPDCIRSGQEAAEKIFAAALSPGVTGKA